MNQEGLRCRRARTFPPCFLPRNAWLFTDALSSPYSESTRYLAAVAGSSGRPRFTAPSQDLALFSFRRALFCAASLTMVIFRQKFRLLRLAAPLCLFLSF